ncbi:hypothetical protein [Thermochromatium tepidum]|jgi:hypothetical protein|uniref:Uncharacterized protein n=1 Tax=Thermochromatium tepidum ATCC 43061 TaxID=316276 RepID=A0A6I6DZ63_THETI|nr:hypothetical protein [Thermochromatium tepidum]QGU32025.1 hypothetical protein E6P07_02890 [Thermochromatium tepidum ATCC 43061]
MPRFAAIATLAATALISGCLPPPPGHFGSFVTSVTPDAYGQRLCRHLDLEDYSACLSEVLEYFEKPSPNDLPYGHHSNAGPIALVLDRRVYLGRYDGSPLVTSFHVTHGNQFCQGGYDAFAGSTDAILAVWCSDGRRGRADLTSALDGRNGIGLLELEDGTRAEIVFGYTALGQAEPYPYVHWTPPTD